MLASNCSILIKPSVLLFKYKEKQRKEEEERGGNSQNKTKVLRGDVPPLQYMLIIRATYDMHMENSVAYKIIIYIYLFFSRADNIFLQRYLPKCSQFLLPLLLVF